MHEYSRPIHVFKHGQFMTTSCQMAYTRRMSRSYRKRPYKRSRRGKYSRRAGAKSFQSRVKRVLMKTSETKYYDIGFENEQLYHNCGTFQLLFPGYIRSISQWFNPWQVIQKGTNRFNRIGDKITPRGMSLKLWIANKLDRPNVQYRIIVAVLPKVVAGDITIPRFDPFQIPNSGALGNYLLNPADTDKGVKFLYDRIVRAESGVSGVLGPGTSAQVQKEYHIYKKIWIKPKRSRDIVFDTTSTDIINKPLAVYVIPYDSYGTLNTDNIASCAGFMRMYYKDL